jgi:hypothetical protein
VFCILVGGFGPRERRERMSGVVMVTFYALIYIRYYSLYIDFKNMLLIKIAKYNIQTFSFKVKT